MHKHAYHIYVTLDEHGLRAQTYIYLKDDGTEDKKAKGPKSAT